MTHFQELGRTSEGNLFIEKKTIVAYFSIFVRSVLQVINCYLSFYNIIYLGEINETCASTFAEHAKL